MGRVSRRRHTGKPEHGSVAQSMGENHMVVPDRSENRSHLSCRVRPTRKQQQAHGGCVTFLKIGLHASTVILNGRCIATVSGSFMPVRHHSVSSATTRRGRTSHGIPNMSGGWLGAWDGSRPRQLDVRQPASDRLEPLQPVISEKRLTLHPRYSQL